MYNINLEGNYKEHSLRVHLLDRNLSLLVQDFNIKAKGRRYSSLIRQEICMLNFILVHNTYMLY